jgi:lipopolysaccharide/colanic/teichoic acid biosynthesis glycosyltransferase
MLFCGDLLIHAISFGLIYFLRKGSVSLEPDYSNYLYLYFISWLIASLITRKYPKVLYPAFVKMIQHTLSGYIILLGLLAFGLFKLEILHISRFIVLLSLSVSFVVEIFAIIIIYRKNVLNIEKIKIHILDYIHYSIFDFALLALWVTALILRDNSMKLYALEICVVVFFSWIISFSTTNSYIGNYKFNYFKFIYPIFKSSVFFSSILIFSLYILKLETSVQIGIVYGALSYVVIINILRTFLYIYKRPRRTDEVATDIFSAELIQNGTVTGEEHFVDTSPAENLFDNNNYQGILFSEQLRRVFLHEHPKLYDFLSRSIKLDRYDISHSIVNRSVDIYNVSTLPRDMIEFYLNLHPINDVRRINEYFIALNVALKEGGVYIGCMEPTTMRYERFINKYPENIAKVLYFFDFLWKRVTPKLPAFQKLYFALTNGKDRAISKGEGLGRLSFCGFDVLALTEYEHQLYFIAKKTRPPNFDKNPSYSPLFKMKRIGKNGRSIYVYKFRTMHPYSEYLQDFIVNNYGYMENGKPANDFRLTAWGKAMRSLWLDELPQLYNVIRGEMKLVGIRPVSERFLAEYPEDLKKIRLRHKPGCIPAYVSLNKQGVSEFIEAEIEYLHEKEKHPITTDYKYFGKALHTILIKKMRSS